jgi:hypothetical protein
VNTPGSPGEQPDPNNPNASAGASGAATAAAEAPATSPEVAPQAAPSPAAKTLAWPSWFAGVDATLAGLTVVLAFMAASFVARNSDLWLHLAAGKRLFAGQYVPGADPFSYTGAERGWVNHSWLLDAVAYLLYGGTGQVLVVAKALVVAGAFALVMAIRRPQFPLWPWAVFACVAVLAAAPQFLLRPLVVSMLFLALTLFLLFRMPHKPGSWRFPIAIGATFWVWSNCDPWFVLGPLALALVLIGELVEKKLLNHADDASAEPGPLGRLPDTATLAKALGVGVLACMLNPHHVKVWEVPFELVKADGAAIDPRLRLQMLAPIDQFYVDRPELGYNLNGLAYAVLLGGGAVVLGLGFYLSRLLGGEDGKTGDADRVPVAHLALWVGFAALSLRSVYAIPFFAVVAVPLAAAQLNAISARVTLKTWGDPRSRLLLLGSSVGRVVCVLGVAALCVLAYPGWVHPETPNPVYARRLAWGVEPDAAMVRATEQLGRWREAEKLPPDARGVIAHSDLANYAAWYAPGEKVFFNGRYNHHRPELADYLAVRRGLGLIAVKDEPPDPKEATDVFARRGAEYVVVHAAPGERETVRRAGFLMTLTWAQYSPWYLDGRTVVFGWRPEPGAEKPSFAARRVDPVWLAFGPEVVPLPEPPELRPPPPPLGWEEQFVRELKVPSPGAEEALGWLAYKQALMGRQEIRLVMTQWPFLAVPATTKMTWHQFAIHYAGRHNRITLPPAHSDSEADAAAMRAIPLLALRAARRAIAHDPDHPDGYYALAAALADTDLPMTNTERLLARVTAYRQCLSRLPPPDKYRRGRYIASAADVAVNLAELYLGQEFAVRDPRTGRETVAFTGMSIDLPPLGDLIGEALFLDPGGRLIRLPYALLLNRGVPPSLRPLAEGRPFILPIDLAREELQKAVQYAQIDAGPDSTEEAKAAIRRLEGRLKAVETAVIPFNDNYTTRKARTQKISELVGFARENSMVGEALRLLTDKDTDIEKEFGDRVLQVAVSRAALMMAVGRLEDAAGDLDELTKIFDRVAANPTQARALNEPALRPLLRQLTYRKMLLTGDYKAAGVMLESFDGASARAGLDPLMAVVAQAKFNHEAALHSPISQIVPLPGGGLLPATIFLKVTLDRQTDAAGARAAIVAKMQQDAEFYFQRGVLSLFEGDIAAAKERFRQSTRKPPDGWRLEPFTPPHAVEYLRLIEMAERKVP